MKTYGALALVLVFAATGCPADEPKAPEEVAVAAQPDEPASGPASKPAPKVIGVKYEDPTCGGAGPCTCVGELKIGMSQLAQIGVDEAKVKSGTPCLLGDFDGNGHLDGAFLGADFKEVEASDVAILMFDEGGVMLATRLPKKVGSLALLREEDRQRLVEPETRMRFDYKDGRFVATRM